MARGRPDEHPPLIFVHRGHEFTVTAVPDGADVELHIADRHGRILLPGSIGIRGPVVPRGRRLNRRSIDTGMAELRKAIEELDHARLHSLLEAPRAAGDFQWTPAEREAAARIDWSEPAATIVHAGYSFAIGVFVTERRMVLLLRDADGPFDAPMSMPRDAMLRAALHGADPRAIGVTAMAAQLRAWNASRVAAFVRNTPRLAAPRWTVGTVNG
ncbi:MAG TPA: hypothetical protein VGM87_24060 [Roseomonas sp.]